MAQVRDPYGLAGGGPATRSGIRPGTQGMSEDELLLLSQLYGGGGGPGGHGRFNSGGFGNFGRNAFGQIGGFGGGGLASLGGFPGLGPSTSSMAQAQNLLASINAGRSTPLTFNNLYDGGGQTAGTGPPDINLSPAEIAAFANNPVMQALGFALPGMGTFMGWAGAHAPGGLLGGPPTLSPASFGQMYADEATQQAQALAEGAGGTSITGVTETPEGVAEFGAGYGGSLGTDIGSDGQDGGQGAGGGAEGPGGSSEPGGNWRHGGYIKPDKDRKLEAVPIMAHEGEVILNPERVKHLGKRNALAIHKGKYNRNKLREALHR